MSDDAGFAVRLLDIHRFFQRGSERLDVLHGLTLEVPERRVPGPDGAQRLGKDDAAQHDRRPRQAEPRRSVGRRRPHLRLSRIAAHPLADAEYRLHLPVLSSASRADGLRERRTSPALAPPFLAAAAGTDHDGPRYRRPQPSHVPSAGPDVGRRTAARRHRPGGRHRSEADHCRRADRRPRCPLGPGNPRI